MTDPAGLDEQHAGFLSERSRLETYQDDEDRLVFYDPANPIAWMAADPQITVDIGVTDRRESGAEVADE